MENKLADNIRRYRKDLGFTQEQLAERLGITLGAVSKWERGGSEPDLSYIMDLAELFHVSVDALIGFTMRGADADAEADRLRNLAEDSVDPEKLAAEYNSAIMKFPNHFGIVFGAACCCNMIGSVYKKKEALRRSLELYWHAVELISQNRDPEISEWDIRNQIAGIYSAMKDHKKAVEEYKKNNISGRNYAIIGMELTQYLKKPEEGIGYTEKAFICHFTDSVLIMNGYYDYYRQSGNPERAVRAAEWTIGYLTGLKEDPAGRSYIDKIICLYYLLAAMAHHQCGRTDKAEINLRMAVRTAVDFDSNPVFTLENILFTERMEKATFYDNSGPTAVEGLKNAMAEAMDDGWVSDEFRKMFDREIG